MRPGLFAIGFESEHGEAPPDLAPWHSKSARHPRHVQVGREHDPHDLGGHEQGVGEVPRPSEFRAVRLQRAAQRDRRLPASVGVLDRRHVDAFGAGDGRWVDRQGELMVGRGGVALE